MDAFRIAALCTASMAMATLTACGGSDEAPSQADRSGATSDSPVAGPSPFIAFTTIHGTGLDRIASVRITVAPLPGTVSRPVSVSYAPGYLARHGYLPAAGTTLTVPLIGLYAGANNDVAVDLNFVDGSRRTLAASVSTAPFSDGVHDSPMVMKSRAPGSALGFDFFYVKPVGSPMIIDTDGHVRWTVPTLPGTGTLNFVAGGFLIGSPTSGGILRVDLDGSLDSSASLDTPDVLDFHHDIEDGKTGQLNSVDVEDDGVTQIESIVQEFLPDGHVIGQWDLGQILSAYMRANGDDPTLFVRPGVDWAHINTQLYDPRDDTIIISSRENFVIKLGYADGDIRWIFGDPAKYWYTFPSLRAKSLALAGDGLVPIGQHGVTIAPDGDLMMFNNGLPSINQPAGAPIGSARPYSAVTSYSIDEAAMTATQTWAFDDGQALYSAICSSARALDDGSILVDFAAAENLTATRIMGIDPAHQVVFDLRYPTHLCDTAWNAQPIALDALDLS